MTPEQRDEVLRAALVHATSIPAGMLDALTSGVLDDLAELGLASRDRAVAASAVSRWVRAVVTSTESRRAADRAERAAYRDMVGSLAAITDWLGDGRWSA